MTIADTTMPDAALAAHVAGYHLARRDLAAARAALEPTLAAPPTEPRARRALADAFVRLAQAHATRRAAAPAAEAVAHARALVDDPSTWRAAAAVAALEGDTEGARELLRRVAAAAPDAAAAWLALARADEGAGHPAEAVAAYLTAVELDPAHGSILSVAERLAALAPAGAATPAQRVRIAVVGSSTLDHVRGYLEVACRQAGLTPEFYLGPFDQYAQDILDADSALYRFAPEVVIMAVHGRALFPDLYDRPFDLDPNERRAAAARVVDDVARLLGVLTARTTALVLLHTFATPQYSPLGALDLRDPFGQTAIFAAINGGLAERVRRDFPSVQLVDEDRVYGRVGKRNVTDPRLWHLARIGIGEGALGELAATYMRSIKPLKSRARKCLVLDLDNTLWGGVVGEDGPHGIALGHEAPGNAYRALQEVILDLWKRGVILAVNSKNNEADAMEALERHPEMILRPRHFAALRINWRDKAANLESIAAELNIGLDSLVFLDDNPAECALVRSRLPQVLTVQLPRDPARYRETLLRLTDFDALTLTEEDRQRGQLYAQRRERQEWEARRAGANGGANGAAADNLDDYLGELGLVVAVAPADEFTIPRVAQLIGKTNQFNLTTRRHNEAAVRAFARSADHAVYTVRVEDRFGDHGLTGVAIVATAGDVWEIDTLLLSCRVLGRGVETALLSALAAAARASGARALRGQFIPTAKNAPAADIYERHAFALVDERDGARTWELDVRAREVAPPAWLTLTSGDEAAAGV